MGDDIRHDDAGARIIGERLAALYRDIGKRTMRELPVYNDTLDVEPIGFRAHDGRALGILITPWFMNVISVALGPENDDVAPCGATVRRALPSGAYDFIVGELGGFGRVETCSLFSPMFEFRDAAAARAVAKAALAALLEPQSEAARRDDTARAATSAAIDRRRFLGGALTGAHT